MYLKIDYQVGLDINNCVAFYTNFDENLITRLRDTYDGICYNGNLIIHVISVVKVGECMFVSPVLSTTGTLSVVFRALVVNYSPGDIIAGCVVRPIKGHGRITMQSVHSNAMIVQTKEDQDTSVLGTDAVVTINATGVYAGPGSDRISVCATLYNPSAVTYYYPIMAGTHAQAPNSESMTREKYISQLAIDNILAPMSAPPSNSGTIMEDIPGITIIQAARDAAEHLGIVSQRARAEFAKLPEIVRKLFYPFREEREPDVVKSGAVKTINLLDVLAIPDNATCLVMCGEYCPLDGKIGVTANPISSFPEDWVLGELAQPLGVVVARRLEKFIDYATAGSVMLREFMIPAKLEASRNLIVLQSKKKG